MTYLHKCFLLDLDGFVIDSELFRDKITKELIKSLGYTYNRDKLKPIMCGKSAVEGMQILVDEYGLDKTAEELVELKKDKIVNLYKHEVPFVPGFELFYQKLFSKVSRAIATSLEEKTFNLVDQRLDISGKFDGHVYHTENVGKSKPAPDVFIYSAEKLGFNPKECIVFEDAPNGLVASIRAGSKTVMLTRTFTEDVIKEKASETLERNLKKDEVLFIPDYSDESLSKVLQYIE